jgi:hypothetical protein
LALEGPLWFSIFCSWGLKTSIKKEKKREKRKRKEKERKEKKREKEGKERKKRKKRKKKLEIMYLTCLVLLVSKLYCMFDTYARGIPMLVKVNANAPDAHAMFPCLS